MINVMLLFSCLLVSYIFVNLGSTIVIMIVIPEPDDARSYDIGPVAKLLVGMFFMMPVMVYESFLDFSWEMVFDESD